MRTFKFETNNGTYTVSLKGTDKRMSTGQIKTSYKLTAPDGTVLFKGDDFGCAPSHKPESKAASITLLGFLTLKPGDTDDDYFNDYTPEQMTWCESVDAEDLASIVYEFENRGR